MLNGLKCRPTCVNSCSHFSYLATVCYFIVLYGCVCHPLINGYDDDDDDDDEYVVKTLQKKLSMHTTQQSSHTNSTVYRPCKNYSPSTEFCRQHISSIFKCTPSKRNERSDGVLVCTVKCMGSGIPMHAHRARGVPASC